MKAWDNRRAVYDGHDPLAERRKAEGPTFRETAAQTMAGLRSGWTNEMHASQWVNGLEAYAFPILGTRPVDSIRGADVTTWPERPSTGRSRRMATGSGTMRRCPYGEVSSALGAIDRSRTTEAARLFLRFLVLTAARSSEARGARWSEIDPVAREWRIPADRMKAKAESIEFRSAPLLWPSWSALRAFLTGGDWFFRTGVVE